MRDLKYKLLVCDMDGTLLNSRHEVSDFTREKISEFIEAGGKFAFCSGREMESLEWQAEEMKLPTDKIVFMALNGCIIADRGQVVHYVSLPRQATLDIAAHFDEAAVYYQIYDKNGLYFKERNAINDDYCRIVHCHGRAVGDIKKFVTDNDIDVVKLMIADQPDNIDGYRADLERKFPQVQWFRSTPFFLEVAAKTGGKGEAVKFLAERYGLDISETAAVGDSQNDLSMIVSAGTGVAVANATDEIKNVADIILPYSNDEDAVGRFIMSFLHSER